MLKKGKRYLKAQAMVEVGKLYQLEDALRLIKEMPAAKFDETILTSVRLGVDPAKNDQQVRDAVVLPAGLGKTQRVIVFADGEKQKEAADAGADLAGLDDLIEKINGGWLEFDVAIATPDVMGKVAKVAKVLGPRGLMPNPKTGTVTFGVGQAVQEAKAGKVKFKVDKGGNIQVPIGKKSFSVEDQKRNMDAVLDAIMRAKPASAKGVYVRTVYVSSAMGPAVAIDPTAYRQ